MAASSAVSPLAGVRRVAELPQKRPWHVMCACLAAGLALAPAPAEVALAAAALVLAALAGARAPALAVPAAALLLAGGGVGQARLAALDAPAARIEDGRQVALRAALTSPPRPSAFGATAEARVTTGTLSGARLLLRIPRWAHLPARVPIGAVLALSGRLRAGGAKAKGATPSRSGAGAGPRGGFDFGAYLRRRGIAGELLVDRARATGRRRGGLAGVLDRMRERAERGVSAGMSADSAGLLHGMVLGQDEAISAALRADFRDSGLAHLLAVSGQNVMLLAALASAPLAAAGLGPRARGAALLWLILVYVPLAGAGPSLQRAGVMGAAGIAATTMSRPSSRWYALILAAAATLALNPRACGDAGWQLSFAAVAGILALGRPLRDGLRWLSRTALPSFGERVPSAVGDSLVEGIAITLAATLATAPLLAHHFGSVPSTGLLANLLALPAVAPAMWLGMVKAALGQAAAPAPPVGWLAGALGPLADLPVAYLAALAERLGGPRGGQLSPPLGGTLAMTGAYGELAIAAPGAPRASAALGPRAEELAAAWRRRPRSHRLGVGAAALVAVVLGGVRLLGTPPPPDVLTVRFLDVGQGDATLVQHPDGAALFDGGPPEAGVIRLLRGAGVRRLSAVVATHASRDHHGGLREVLERYPVGVLLDGGDGTRDPGFRALVAAARRRGVRRVPVIAPMTLATGSLHVRLLSPPPRPPGPPPEDPNPRAVVAVVSCGGFDLFLSADAESEALLPLALTDVEAMKVPHHGSADPGLRELLSRLRPEVAAIPVGPNTYGHPTRSALATLERAGVRTFRTDRDGTVTLTVEDGGQVRAAVER